MKQISRTKVRRRILWGAFAVIATLLVLCCKEIIRYEYREMIHESYDAMPSYETAVVCFYDKVRLSIPFVQLCVFAWYGLIRIWCGKTVLPERKKPLRCNPRIIAAIFGMLTIFLVFMSLRARADYFAVLADSQEAYSGEHAANWGLWRIAVLLSAELTAGFAIAGFIRRRKKS